MIFHDELKMSTFQTTNTLSTSFFLLSHDELTFLTFIFLLEKEDFWQINSLDRAPKGEIGLILTIFSQKPTSDFLTQIGKEEAIVKTAPTRVHAHLL